MPYLRMKRSTSTILFAAAAFAAGLSSLPLLAEAQAYGYDCAHGPDTYRVRNVAEWDTLNIRSHPTARSQIVGRIDAYGSGIHCLGPCKGNWCRVSWRGVVGWTNMKYLGE